MAPDLDADGWFAHEDCDDNNSTINPGATEICDGVDNDCNELVDNDELGGTASFQVPGTSNLYGAGHDIAPAPGGAGAGTLPPVVELAIAPGPNRAVRLLSVSGTVNYGPGPNSADGITREPACELASLGGLAGIITNTGRAMNGVFLDDLEPEDPAPAPLNFSSGIGFSETFPGVAQIMLTGDGLTGNGSGDLQVFHAPDDATRFYLGFLDAASCGAPPGAYGDNSGSIVVNLEVVCVVSE